MRKLLMVFCSLIPLIATAQIAPREATVDLEVNHQAYRPSLKIIEGTAVYGFNYSVLSNDIVTIRCQSDYKYVYIIMDNQGVPTLHKLYRGTDSKECSVEIELDHAVGTEVYCLLFCRSQKDALLLEDAIKEVDMSEVNSRLQERLGERLANTGKDVRYIENHIGFSSIDRDKIVLVNIELVHN